jgi:hypothetical protein
MKEVDNGTADISDASILYHFDRVFRILEIYLPEKAEKFSFGLWRFLKQSFFSAVTRD